MISELGDRGSTILANTYWLYIYFWDMIWLVLDSMLFFRNSLEFKLAVDYKTDQITETVYRKSSSFRRKVATESIFMEIETFLISASRLLDWLIFILFTTKCIVQQCYDIWNNNFIIDIFLLLIIVSVIGICRQHISRSLQCPAQSC